MPKRFLERFRKIDYLISIRGTGNPAQLASKLEISESMVYEYLSVLRELGTPIGYDKDKQTYFYEKKGRFKIIFEESS